MYPDACFHQLHTLWVVFWEDEYHYGDWVLSHYLVEPTHMLSRTVEEGEEFGGGQGNHLQLHCTSAGVCALKLGVVEMVSLIWWAEIVFGGVEVPDVL